jgi:hypothetical protein
MPEAVAVPAANPAPASHAGTEPVKPVAVDAKADAKPEGEKPAPKPTHKFKVNGEEKEVPLEELEKHFGTFATSQARLKEAAETKKAAAEEKAKILNALKNADVSALRDAGLSESEIDGLAVKHLSDKQQKLLEEERIRNLPPTERELEELRAQKKAREEQDKKAETSKAEQEHAVKVKEEEGRIATFVIASLEELPEQYRRNDFIAQRVFDAVEYFEQNKEALEKKGFDVKLATPKFIAEKVRSEVKALLKTMADASADEELDDLVSDSVAGRVLQRRQDKARKAAHPALTGEPVVRGKKADETEETPRVTQAQLLRRAYFGGGK